MCLDNDSPKGPDIATSMDSTMFTSLGKPRDEHTDSEEDDPLS